MRYEAKFTPLAADVLQGYRMHHRQRDDTWKLLLLGAALTAAVFGVAAYVMRFPLFAGLGVIVGASAFASPLLLELQVRRVAKKILAEEVTYFFTDDGVEFSSRLVQVKHSWDLITKASLDERGILLYTGPMNYAFIPARAFVHGYFPRGELKSLLAQKLKRP